MSTTNEATEVNTEATTSTAEEQSVGSDIFTDAPSEDTLALLDDSLNTGDNTSSQDDGTGTIEEAKSQVGVSTEDTGGKDEGSNVKKETEVEQDARFSKAFTQLSKKEKDLALREEQLKGSAAAIENLNKAAQNFSSQPVDFIKAQLAAFTGSDDPEKVDAAFRDLYESLTMHVLGADAPAEMQEQSQYQKLQRDFERYKQEQADKVREAEESALESQRSAKVTQAQARIKTQLIQSKEKFPYLINQGEEDPGELVFEVVWADYNARREAGEENPTPMTIEEAASKANNHYQQIAQKWAKLVPSATTTNVQPTGQPANNRPGNSRTLTNSNASVAPTVEGSNYIEDDEESKLKAMELLFQ